MVFGRCFRSERESEAATEAGSDRGDTVGSPRGDGSVRLEDRSSTDESDTEMETLPNEVWFDILRNPRRRRVVRYLLDSETPVALGPLAEHVGGIENEKDPSALTSQERKSAYVALYQMHLPRMADAAVVEFDKPRGQIEAGPHLDTVAEYLDIQDGGTAHDPWVPLYVSIIVIGFGSYLSCQAGLVHSGEFCVIVLGLSISAVFITSGVDLWRHRQADRRVALLPTIGSRYSDTDN